MKRRRGLFFVCLGLMLAMAGSLWLTASQVTVFTSTSIRPAQNNPGPLVLIQDVPTAQDGDSTGGRKSSSALVGVQADLLKVGTERLRPSDSIAVMENMDIPQLLERVANDSARRDPDTMPDPAFVQSLDAIVNGLVQQNLRQDIGVPKRIVRPLNTRILPADTLPVLSSDFLMNDPLTLPLAEHMGVGGAQPGTPLALTFQLADAQFAPRPPDVLPAEMPGKEAGLTLSLAASRETAKKSSLFDGWDERVKVQLDTYCPPDDPQGYFRLAISPKPDIEGRPVPRDITLVIEATTGVPKERLDEIRASVVESLGLLRPEDRVNVAVVRHKLMRLSPGPIAVSPELGKRVERFLANVGAGGDGDIVTALRPILMTPLRPEATGIVIVIAEGKAKPAMKESRQVIQSMTAGMRSSHSVFVVTSGKSPSRSLFELLAFATRGEVFTPQKADSMQAVIASVVKRVQSPLMVKLRLDMKGYEPSACLPRQLPDLYQGTPVYLYGRFDVARETPVLVRISDYADLSPTVAVLKKFNLRQRDFQCKILLRKSSKEVKDLDREWAVQQVYAWLSTANAKSDKSDFVQRARALAKKYNIRTCYDE